MATPMTAARFESLARAAGIQLIGHGAWQTRNRGNRGTGWGPVNGVMIHQTVTSNLDATIQMVAYEGQSAEVPAPLYAGVVAKDGTLHMTGWGRCNHAGLGDDDVLAAVIPERALPAPNEANTDGNSRFYGFAGLNLGNGKDPWPMVQMRTLAMIGQVICDYHGWSEKSVIGHREWTNQKIDPYGPLGTGSSGSLMPMIRADVRSRLLH